MTMLQLPSRKEKNQGMNWISQHKRLAIYFRDNLRCAYCTESVGSVCKLTLDHILPYSKGGGNNEENLVTCCLECNSKRGNKSLSSFIMCIATEKELDHNVIMKNIKNQRRRALNIPTAKSLIDQMGSCAKVLQQYQ